MLTNTTAAAAPSNVINSEQKQLVFFGAGSSSQTSQTFTVDQQPFYLSAFNLATGDIVTVQQVFGQGSGTEVAPFAPVNGAVVLTPTRTKVRIDHPGRYQLLHSGPSALGTFTVAGGAAVMTSDPLGDLAEALFSIFTTLGGNITVTAPITLTGAGTTANPYDIGFEANFITATLPLAVSGSGPYNIVADLAANSDIETGTSVITLVDPAGLAHIVNANHSTLSARLGVGATAAADATAVGDGATASGTAATAIGQGTVANNTNSTALGNLASSGAAGAVALGPSSSAANTDSLAVGHSATATANGAAAFGHSASASNATATAIGASASATGASSTAVGNAASVTVDNSCAFGGSATAGFANSSAIGTGTATTQANQVVLGNSSVTQLVTAGSIIAGGAISPSDQRLKKNVESEFESLELINQLAPVTFLWDRGAVLSSKVPMNEDEYGKKQHGLIAQEVEGLLPELIETIDRGSGPYKFVRYDRLIPILIGAIQELSLEVKSLKEKQ